MYTMVNDQVVVLVVVVFFFFLWNNADSFMAGKIFMAGTFFQVTGRMWQMWQYVRSFFWLWSPT